MRGKWTIGLGSAQVAALVATYFVPNFGAQMWHHAASLGGVLLLSAVAWKPLSQSRRILAVGALVTSILAIISGFYLLYWKEGIRVDGYQDWGVWWHVAWSWGAAVFFFQHTWINRKQFVHFFKRTASWGPGILHGGAYLLVLVAFAVTWTSPGRTWFTGGNYIALTFATWLVITVPTFVVWLSLQRKLTASQYDTHWKWRRRADLGLVPFAALATLSGVPLVFLGDLMDGAGLKYTSKYWHTWPSIVFTVLVFAHSVQVWSIVRGHWKALGRQTARKPE